MTRAFLGPRACRLIAVAVSILAVLAATPAPAAGLGDAPPANLIVGFKGRYLDTGLLQSLGAATRGSSAALGIAAVHASDPATFTRLALLDSDVAWVESNDATRADSSQWDSSQWDASGWDSSQWDASGWDASGWDSSQWDASGWDSSQWDASGWDASGWDSSQWDASGWDASGWDSSQWDASGWDSSQWDASGWDASGWDASGWDSATMTNLGRSSSGPPGTDPLVRWQWSLAALNLTRQAAAAPSAKTICFVDSGVDYTHPDLVNRMATPAGHDFVNNDPDPMDDGGHGTHVAGIAAAAIGNGKGIAGASSARIMAMKVLDANGTGTEFNLALGIEKCRERGASVISMSLGTDQNSKAVHRAVVDAFAAGIVMVASVGNTGTTCDCVRWPAAYPQVIAVGAVMPNSGRAPFSAVSNGVDFVAPGYAIVSSVPGNRYVAASGTSQAVPFVAAAAALLLQAGEDGAGVGQALRATAIDLGPAGHDGAFGHGSVNVGAALAHAAGG